MLRDPRRLIDSRLLLLTNLESRKRENPASLPDDYRAVVPPDPIPNSEVKRCIADGSVGFPHVRVGHRQVPIQKPLPLSGRGFFIPAPSEFRPPCPKIAGAEFHSLHAKCLFPLVVVFAAYVFSRPAIACSGILIRDLISRQPSENTRFSGLKTMVSLV